MSLNTLSPSGLLGLPVSSSRRPWWRIVLEAMIESRRAAAEREIRRLEALRGRPLSPVADEHDADVAHALAPFRGE